KVRNISAFNFRPVKYYHDPLRDNTEMWYEGNAFYAAFRWNGPLYYFDERIGEGEFAVVLNHDGLINFYYNGIEMDENVLWYAGVSAGDESDYTLLKNSNSLIIPEVSSFVMIPEFIPENLNFSADGLLIGTPEISEKIFNLTIKVNDDRRISNTKKFQLSDGLIFDYTIDAGEDGLIENGEEFTISLTVKNIFGDSFHNVVAGITGDYPFIEILNAEASYGDFAPGESKTIANAFTLKVDENCPNNFNFLTDLALSAEEAEWMGKINFEAVSPSMMISSLVVQDDNNNRLDPGETVDISIKISNTGLLDVENIQMTLSTNHASITIHDPVQQYGNMTAGEEKSMLFSVSAGGSVAVGEPVVFELQLVFDPDYQIEESYQITIGQYTALIFNKSSNPASSLALLASMESLSVDLVSTNTLPDEFALYRSVFICLGTIYQNVALTQDEASHLVTYLNQGGNIYKEGTMTWTYDPQTSLHPKFRTGAQSGSFISFNTINGVAGTFTEGLNFDFAGSNNFLPCLMHPIDPAFPIFYADNDEEKTMATAYPGWIYKTIGAIHEFGNLGDESNTEERRDYLYKIFEFFGLEDFIVDVEESGLYVENKLDVSAFPNPFVNVVNFMIDTKNEARVDLNIYDLSGQLIKNVVSKNLPPGFHTIHWSGKSMQERPLPPGIYIYQLKSGSNITTGKLIRL
ncbi:MAG: T9SS type A sorting domain-containing protein, partial [Bacteroidales bacterium]|nr:T9SS type A sorting domain-containing protein [Bacteroidales bacterium]